MAQARDHLVNELKLMGARYIMISTNVPTKSDGLPYANYGRIEDPGVAVYFDYDGESTVFACDKWQKVEHNMRAVGKTIEAIRGIARWGSSDMMKRAVSAFKELNCQPDPADWRRVMDFEKSFSWRSEDREDALKLVKERYHQLSRVHHADMGGNEEEMKRINIAWEAARRELGG